MGVILKIWGRANSTNVQKVLWCCEELGVAYERVDAGGAFGRTGEPQFRAMNPHGGIPVVEDGDVVLWESNTILRYLATTRGGARLYPNQPVPRSEVERWMDWQLGSLAIPTTTLTYQLVRTPPADRRADEIGLARRRLEKEWSLFDGVLATRDFAAGAGFTLADIALGPFAYRWLAFDMPRPETPRLAAWVERLAGRGGFATHVAQPLT